MQELDTRGDRKATAQGEGESERSGLRETIVPCMQPTAPQTDGKKKKEKDRKD